MTKKQQGRQAMKATKRNRLALLMSRKFPIAAGLILATLILFTIFIATRKPIVVFYELPQPVISAIEKQAGTAFAFRVIADDKPLEAHRKDFSRASLVFMYDGREAAEIGKNASIPDEKLISLMPSAMRESGKNGDKRFGIPVLYDHFGIDWNVTLLKTKSIPKPKTLSELVKAANAIKGNNLWPIICAGGNDEDLLMLTGALVISQSGIGAYDALVKTAAEGKSFDELIKATELKKSLDTLIEWRKQGLVHPEWFRMKSADVHAFIQNDYACFFAISLSEHRQIDARTVEKLDSMEFPTDRKELDRGILAPAVVAIQIHRILPDRGAVRKFIDKLLHNESQAALAGYSGLAPVNSNATAPDKQADDARFWIASSMKAFPDPARAAYPNHSYGASLAAAIRQYLVAKQ